jgi:hypothetical protein
MARSLTLGMLALCATALLAVATATGSTISREKCRVF